MSQPSDISLRPLEARDEYEACVRLQREVWGEHFTDVVPATILMVCQRVGGVAAGAFDPNRRLLGFVFGISGVRDGRLAHWSYMLAVRPEVRRTGLGKRLKLFQRELLLELGVQTVYWSFDPLVARNANLNVNGLGARPREYVVNMYGETDSTLHRGLETDRLVVEWPIADAALEPVLAGQGAPLPPHADRGPIVNPDALTGSAPHVAGHPVRDAPWIRIALPSDIDAVKTMSLDDARLWQLAVRRAFLGYLSHGYRVVGFTPGGRGQHAYYLLTNLAAESG